MKRTKETGINEVYPYIYRVTLPLPGKKPGPVNVYLFIGDTITLLDTGTLQTYPILMKAINKLGLGPSDIKQIVFTHGHIDHYGAAKTILSSQKEAAQTVAHADDVQSIEKGYEVAKKVTNAFLKQMGLPYKYRAAMLFMSRVFTKMSRPCPVTRYISDDERIQLGNYTARVIHTPGHSRGSVCLHIEKDNILFSGDTVLPHITPNAFVMLDAHRKLPIRSSQAEFYSSIERIESLNPAMVFPAHGNTIENLKSITDMYRKNYAERDSAILSLLKKDEHTVYELAWALFPNELGRGGRRLILELYLAISEIFTHLQVLEKRNLVHMDIRKGRVVVRGK